jgi:hypothetical protein
VIDPDWVQFYRDNGFTLLTDQKPPLNTPFKAARVVQDFGFGGVRLRTRRIEVEMVQTEHDVYYDTQNKETVPYGQIEAWR